MPLMRFYLPVLLALLITACTLEPATNRYQQPASTKSPAQGAVAELQHLARVALERGAFGEAVDYLQRAIRIEPRNPLSWHYLAQSYRRSGDYARCVEMAQRSYSYSQPGDGLDQANRKLEQNCQQGY